jgi:Family of unknown function (DUF6262)/Basic region leucine zipper
MLPDPTPLATAARRKREHAQTRARKALRELAEHGRPISFQAVARQAGVSRQWLHQQPDLRNEIELLRDRNIADTQPRTPDAQRASTASLRQRLDNLHAENHRLREQVAELKAELAIAYAQRRAEQ